MRRLPRLVPAAPAAAAAACLAALGPQDGGTPAPLHAAPLQPIGGLSFVHTVSRLVYDQAPEEPVRLEVFFGFPDRSRWHRTTFDGDPRVRDVEYRYGDHVFVLPSGAARSEELGEEERDGVLLRMELRRAALLWPEGFAWRPADPPGSPGAERRVADVHRSAADPGSAALGTLEVELGPGGRPARMLARGADGEERDGLDVLAWREHEGRCWPARLVASFAGRRAWEEEVETVTGRSRFLDAAFLPPHERLARQSGAAAAGSGLRLVSLDLVPVVQRSAPLPEGAGFEEALAAHGALLAAAAAELGPEGPRLDPTPTFELARDGRPRSCLVRLLDPGGPVPPGWTAVPERLGLAFPRLPSLDAVGRLAVEALEDALPAGARPGAPYLRVPTSGGALRPGLFLPYGSTGGTAGDGTTGDGTGGDGTGGGD